LTALGPSRVIWRKSRLCESGACVEVAVSGHDATARKGSDELVILIRDSEHPTEPILELASSTWIEFITGIKENGSIRRVVTNR
jgi:Domain of unknown function (DUF397)